MPLSIDDFRPGGKGKHTPEQVRESQRKRFASVEVVDKIQALDTQWREAIFEGDNLRKEDKLVSKEIGTLKKDGKDSTEQYNRVMTLKTKITENEERAKKLLDDVLALVGSVGNIVHDSVPVSKDEADNLVVETWGECKRFKTMHHHHQLLIMIDGGAFAPGVTVAGHRGYFLKGCGVMLNQALINYGLSFLSARGYTPLQPPFFMKKEIMAETAQLSEFDEALYKVSGDGEDKYLIATSEQPISAFHREECLRESDLPKRYAGYSTCFRKEAGSHGRDAWGIFRIHQFEKVEQFVVTTPSESWNEQTEMINTAKEFYKTLNLPYRVVNIVSGELNNAAAKKLDLEAWFPTLGVFRELVSCSNCTDYQARAMETRFDSRTGEKAYVHMLNATLTATERTICCILENYQTEEGVLVPEVLQPFMGGLKIMKFVNPCPVNTTATRQAAAASKADQQTAAATKTDQHESKKVEPKQETAKSKPTQTESNNATSQQQQASQPQQQAPQQQAKASQQKDKPSAGTETPKTVQPVTKSEEPKKETQQAKPAAAEKASNKKTEQKPAQEAKQQKAAPAAKADAPAPTGTPEQVAAQAQGEVVRKLKADKASKDEITAAVTKLKELKAIAGIA